MVDEEQLRVSALLDAQTKAAALFEEVQRRGIIRAGIMETQASNEIRDLAAQMFGVKRHWHKRLVRSGPNAMLPYRKRPKERALTDDDFGRSYVIGNDPVKHQLKADLATVFDAGRRYFETHPQVTGIELFDEVVRLSEAAGGEFGGTIAGHVVGRFPHDKIPGDDDASRITTAIGSSRFISSIGHARSVASMSSCSTSELDLLRLQSRYSG